MINDSRGIEQFKKQTFSGYKKSEVINVLFKCIDSKNIETSCNWLIECIISGYAKEIWEKLCMYYFKTIHINNIELLKYINKSDKTVKIFLKQNDQLNLRNNQTILNLFVCCVVLFISSSITVKHGDIKIKKEDFQLNNLQNKLNSTMNILPDEIVGINESPEIKLIANEIYFNLQSRLNNRDNIAYWIFWILEWEKLNLKNKINWTINPRNVNVKKKYQTDIVWIIWDIIIFESKKRTPSVKKNVDIIYNLYIQDFDKNKRNKRINYIMMCISLLSCKTKSKNLIDDLSYLIQAQCNYHIIIESKKMYEKNDVKLETLTNKKVKNEKQNSKKQQIKLENEKTKNLLEEFNEIDRLLLQNV
jgi:hypothetical protein